MGLVKNKALFKYTETNLISLFNVIHLHFNAPVPVFHRIFNSVRKKVLLVASFTNFAQRQFLEHTVTQLKPECIFTNRRVKLTAWLGNVRHNQWLRNSKVNHQPVRLSSQFFGNMEGAILVHFTVKGETINSQIFICLAQ
jgi:hypothetical protein